MFIGKKKFCDFINLFSLQGLQQDEEIRKVQRENKARYAVFFFSLPVIFPGSIFK